MKPIVSAVASLLLWMCSPGAAVGREVIYHDRLVTVSQQLPFLPHGTEVTTLTVKGRSFRFLYSYRYAFIPPWNSIAFVTHRDGGSYDIHIFNLNTDLDMVVTSNEPFGAHLAQRGECYLRSADKTVAVFVEKHFKAAHGYLNRSRVTISTTVEVICPQRTSNVLLLNLSHDAGTADFSKRSD